MKPQEARDLATKLIEKGLPVFPIALSWNIDSQSIDKAPLSSEGFRNGHLDASTDPETVEQMFLKTSLGSRQRWGVGLYPGPAGYIVLDVDVKGSATGLEDLDRLEEELGKLPATTRVDSPSGGFHLYYRRPKAGDRIGNQPLAPGVEIRCDAGWVVAPGVSTEWGEWRWDRSTPRIEEAPRLPDAWARKISERKPDGSREPIPEKLTQGHRHAALLRVAGAMRRQGAGYPEIHAALSRMNEARCDPPKPADTIEALARDVAERYPPEPDLDATVRVPAPIRTDARPHGEQCMALEKTVDTFTHWLHLPDPDHIVAALGAVAANVLTGDPVWIQFVGPPGSGKTEAIQPLSALPYVHMAATLTEPALLSGVPKKSTEPGATGGLLRQVGDFGILLVKDFSGVLSMHREQRSAVLAALREIFDGSWSRPVGTGGGRVLEWQGQCGIIGAVTPSIDRHSAVMGALGERFVLYRLTDETSEAKAGRALANFGDEAEMRADLAQAVTHVLEGVAHTRPDRLTDEDRDRLVAAAEFAVRARTAVERDGYTRTVVTLPEYEHSTRLAKQLAQLRAGILAVGADDQTAWRIVTKAGLDSIPRLRWRILETLRNAEYPLKTSDLIEATDIPKRTLDEHLEDLDLLALIEREKSGSASNSPWTHRLSEAVRGMWPDEVGEKRQREGAVSVKSQQPQGSSPSLNNPSPVREDISRPLDHHRWREPTAEEIAP